MQLVNRYLKYTFLSLSVVLLPLLLLFPARIFDVIHDRSSQSAALVRWLPVHFLFLLLIFWTIRKSLSEDFENRETIPKRSSLWVVASIGILMFLILIMFWPISNWQEHLFGGNGDGYNWRWQIWRFSQELRQWNLLPTRFDDVISPYGVDLRLNDGYLPMYIGGIWNLFTGPTLAYNLTLATSVALNFYAAQKLSLLISASHLTAVIAGIIMCTAPSLTMRQLGHLNLCFPFVTCLAAIEGIRLLNGSKLRIWQPVLVLALGFYSSFYFFILSGIFYFGCMVVRLAVTFINHRDDRNATLRRFGCVVVFLVVAISPFVFARYQYEKVEISAGAPSASARIDEYMYYSADPRSFFFPAVDALVKPPKSVEFRQKTSPNTVENTAFPGYLAIISVFLLILLVRKWRWLIASFWAIFSILALGPTLIWGKNPTVSYFFPRALVESLEIRPVAWLPYQDFFAIPGMSALRTPNRFAMMLPILGVIAFSVLFSEISKSNWSSKRRTAVVCGALMLLVPNIRASNYWYNTEYSPPIENALSVIRKDPSKLNVFIAGQNCLRTISLVNLQIETKHPMIGCQTFSAAVPWYSGLQKYRNSGALSALQCEPSVFGMIPMNPNNVSIENSKVLTNLKATLNVGYIVFPKKIPCDDQDRTNIIINILESSGRTLANTDEYLIIAI